jgi:hypothetical protein
MLLVWWIMTKQCISDKLLMPIFQWWLSFIPQDWQECNVCKQHPDVDTVEKEIRVEKNTLKTWNCRARRKVDYWHIFDFWSSMHRTIIIKISPDYWSKTLRTF